MLKRLASARLLASCLVMLALSSETCRGQDSEEPFGGAPTVGGRPTVMTVLGETELLNNLQLNQGQRDEVAKILAEYTNTEALLQQKHAELLQGITSIRDRLRKRVELRAEMRSALEKKLRDAESTLRQLFNAQQLSALDKKLGTAAIGSDRNGSTTDAGRPTSDSAVIDSAGVDSVGADSVGAGTSSAPPPGEPAGGSASFAVDDPTRGAPALGAVGGQASDSQAVTVPAQADVPVTRVAFNFYQAGWPDVLRLFAESAKLNLNIRDTPPGSFTYYDRQQYTPLEALDIMNRFLLQDGFLLLPHDRFLTVLDAKKGVPPNLVKTVTPAELSSRGDTEYLRVAFALGDREAGTAAEEVRDLLGPQGTVVPLKSANSIVVADITANLSRVKQLLEPPPKVDDADRMFRSFTLQHIDAPSAAGIVSSLFGLQAGLANVSEAGSATSRSSRGSRGSRGSGEDIRAAMRERFAGRGGGRGGGDPRSSPDGTPGNTEAGAAAAQAAAKVTVDLRTNTLLVTATAAEMKLVEEIVESVDVPPSQQGRLGNLASIEPYLQVYELNTASASEVSKTLTVLHPGMVINEDGSAKRIHIWATVEKHREIAAHIRQLDGAISGEVIAIVRLNGQNAYDVSTKLTSLYEGDAAGAPNIELDPTGRGLMIRGNASQIAQIRALVDQLDAGDPYETQQAVQLVPVSSNSSAFLQQAIGALYPQITVTSSVQSDDAATSANSSRSDRNRNSTSQDAERAARIQRFMEMRARFGGFGRGSSEGGGDRGRGGRGGGGRGGGDRGGGDRSSRGGR